MAMSKAFRGLMLPAPFKAQECGHTYRASHCKVCPHCYGVRTPVYTAQVVPIRRKASDPLEKAAKALQTASGGSLSYAEARDWVCEIVKAA